MVRFEVELVVGTLAYLKFSATPVSGNIPCAWVKWVGGRCDEYKRLKSQDRLLSCSYMCTLKKSTSCYNYEKNGSPCLVFGVHATNGGCVKGECIPILDAIQHFKKNSSGPPKRTLDCEHGHDYLYDEYGPFACKYYCKNDGRHANRPDGTLCQRPNTAKQGVCDSYGYCVRKR
ncbi:uncharacterized protein LOC135398201 [Ornithodoros turicata]|uniref:uncharacterized protein LOC135398201 n=1 Tax=Ornithodoros turicata TaxID=34597 RepID=UPI00313891FF